MCVRRPHMGRFSGHWFLGAGSMLPLDMSPLIYSHGIMKPSYMTVPCWVCSVLILRRAKECPHCGHPDPVEESAKRFEERRGKEQDNAIETRKAVWCNVWVWLLIVGIWPLMWLISLF